MYACSFIVLPHIQVLIRKFSWSRNKKQSHPEKREEKRKFLKKEFSPFIMVLPEHRFQDQLNHQALSQFHPLDIAQSRVDHRV